MVISKLLAQKKVPSNSFHQDVNTIDSIVPKILCKVGCLFSMVVVSLLPHAACNGQLPMGHVEFGGIDHRKDAAHFTCMVKSRTSRYIYKCRLGEIS